MISRSARAGVTILLAAVLTTPAAGQTTRPSAGTYANQSKELVPYGRFKNVYKWMFAEPQPFLGAGREKPTPPGLRVVKIGFLGPLEGSHEVGLGRHMLQGATLAVEEANSRNGYRGLPFELVVRDDVGLWGASSNKFVELADERVWAVLGSVDGASTHIALRVALKYELPMVTTACTAPDLTETRIPWLVRVNADDRQLGYALADYIYRIKEHKRVAALRVNNRYGRTGIAEFRDAATRLGSPLLLELRYAVGESDFSAQLERIKKSSADAVVLWADAREASLIVTQMRKLGITLPLYSADRVVDDDFLREAGQHAEGMVVAYPFNLQSTDPAYVAFRKRYVERFGEEPDWIAAHSYDGANMTIQAIREGGLNRVRIRDELMEMTRYRGVTGDIPLDPSGNDIGPVWLAELKGGAFRFFPSTYRPS